MYDPVKDGMEKDRNSVSYKEAKPPKELADLVHSYWELKTKNQLANDFTLHAIPDACINILLNQKVPEIAGITALQVAYTELNLGKDFYYAGIQFLPGVWKGDLNETSDRFIGSAYFGNLPLIEFNTKTCQLSFEEKQPIFTELVMRLVELELVAVNPVTKKILSNLDSIHNVAEMADFANLSPRQLQRILKKTTGFSPHGFLKVMRFQRSFQHNYLNDYTDQSHFIHSFKRITGYTPTEYFRKYDV